MKKRKQPMEQSSRKAERTFTFPSNGGRDHTASGLRAARSYSRRPRRHLDDASHFPHRVRFDRFRCHGHRALHHLRACDPAAPASMAITLYLASFEVPEAFLPVCEALNHGYFDPATGFVTSTLGLRAKLPNAAGKDPSQSLLIMRTMGWIGSAGFQIGGGVGSFISGLLLGGIFCCTGGRSQLGPRP
jgi:hypothetical protein